MCDVDRCANIKTSNTHALVILLWVHFIIGVYWSDGHLKNTNIEPSKKDMRCSFEKKPVNAAIWMNHRDDACWAEIQRE